MINYRLTQLCVLCGMPAEEDDDDVVRTVKGESAHQTCINKPVEKPGFNHLYAPDDGVYAG